VKIQKMAITVCGLNKEPEKERKKWTNEKHFSEIFFGNYYVQNEYKI